MTLPKTYTEYMLLSSILGIDIAKVITNQFTIDEANMNIWLKKRDRLLAGEPLDYVVGYVNFLGNKINLSSKTLIPRPETQEWTEWVIEMYTAEKLPTFDYLVDLGTGSGVVGISLNRIAKNLILTDIQQECLQIANQNCLQNNIHNFTTILSDGLQNQEIEKILGQNSWGLVANLPYLPIIDKERKTENNLNYEPDLALYSGTDGLKLFTEVVENLVKIKNQPRYIFFELDPRNIYSAKDILDKYYNNLAIWSDSLQNARVLYSTNLTIPYKKPSNSN